MGLYKDCFEPLSRIVVDVFGNGNVRQCLINTGQRPTGNLFKEDVRGTHKNIQHYSDGSQEISEKWCQSLVKPAIINICHICILSLGYFRE